MAFLKPWEPHSMVQPVVVVSPSAAAGRADGQRRGARGTRPSSRASSTPRPRPRRLRRPGKLFDVGGASVSHFMLRQPLRKNESVLTWRSGVLGISAPYLMKYQKFSQIAPLLGTHDLGSSHSATTDDRSKDPEKLTSHLSTHISNMHGARADWSPRLGMCTTPPTTKTDK